MNKKILLSIGVVAVIVLLAVFYNKASNQNAEQKYLSNDYGIERPFKADEYPGTTMTMQNTTETLFIASFGTSDVRGAEVYDTKTKKEIASFCHKGDPVFWNDYVLYADCTTSKELEIKAQVVQDGEFAPVIYKLNPYTNQKGVLMASNNLHIYRLPTQSELKDSDSSIKLKEAFVSKLSDWSDINKWKEGEKIVSLDLAPNDNLFPLPPDRVVGIDAVAQFAGEKIGFTSLENSRVFASYEILGEEEKENEKILYLWVLIEEYSLESGKLVSGSGTSLPVKMTEQNTLSGWVPQAYEVPGDGSKNPNDVRKIFPKSAQAKIFTGGDEARIRVESLEEKNIKEAKKYFGIN